jgi:hypothetical protein
VLAGYSAARVKLPMRTLTDETGIDAAKSPRGGRPDTWSRANQSVATGQEAEIPASTQEGAASILAGLADTSEASKRLRRPAPVPASVTDSPR